MTNTSFWHVCRMITFIYCKQYIDNNKMRKKNSKIFCVLNAVYNPVRAGHFQMCTFDCTITFMYCYYKCPAIAFGCN